MSKESANSQISTATVAVSDAKNLLGRRKAAKDLLDLVKKNKIRERVKDEAYNAGRQAEAMASRWKRLLDIGYIFAQKNLTSPPSTKLTESDIMLSFDFLKLAGKDEDLHYLESRAVKDLVDFCLRVLTEDRILEVAECSLLEMLDFICSKRDLVCHLAPTGDGEIEFILAELERRVGPQEEPEDELDTLTRRRNVSEKAKAKSGKAFRTLLETCLELGVDLESLFSKCMYVILRWCKRLREEQSESLSESWKDMMAAAASMLRGYPELAVSWMSKDENGERLLAFARKGKGLAKSSDEHVILNRYFLAHLSVCRAAGKLQGLLPGDLGKIGRATLSRKRMKELLNGEKDRLMKGSIELTPFRAQNQRRPQDPNPSDKQSVQGGLELSAHLLACLQRRFIADHEWNNIENRDEYLWSHMPPIIIDPVDDVIAPQPTALTQCPVEELASSPWFEHIVKPLLSLDSSGDSPMPDASQASALSSADGSITDHVLPTTGSAESDFLDWIRNPNNQFPSKQGTTSNHDIFLLKLICACAETFPIGESWTTSANQNWYRFVSKDKLRGGISYFKGCSPTDMALVIHLVANILECCGGADGDHQAQIWSLLCLVRLTESSALVTFCSESSVGVLGLAWQRVWSILFRSDLHFVSFTAEATENSLGELVLVLLTEIIRQKCTETSLDFSTSGVVPNSDFLIEHQEQLWQLPVFQNAFGISVPAVFEVINAMLHTVGLREGGHDSIDRMIPLFHSDTPRVDDTLKSTRRFRLLCLCLRHLQGTVDTGECSSARDKCSMLFACIASLVAGFSVSESSTFANEGSIDPLLQCTPDGSILEKDTSARFRVTSFLPRATSTFEKLNGKRCTIFQLLWDFGALGEIRTSDNASCSDLIGPLELGEQTRRVLRRCSENKSSSRHADFVSKSAFSSLQGYATGVLLALMSRHIDILSNQENQLSTAPISFLLKGLVTVATSRKSTATSEIGFRGSSIADGLDCILSRLKTVHNESTLVATDLLQLFHAFFAIHISDSKEQGLPDSMTKCLPKFVVECSRLLELYAKGGDEEEETSNTQQNDDLSDASDEENISPPAAKKQKLGKINDRPMADQNIAPTFRNACRFASALMVLRPSIEICELIYHVLTYRCVEKEDVYRNDFYRKGACHSLALFCDKSLLSGPTESDDKDELLNKIVSLSAELVQEIRDFATPGSEDHLFGFRICAELAHSTILSSASCKKLTKLFIAKDSDGSTSRQNRLEWRPSLRALQLVSSSEAMIEGPCSFRRKFAKSFESFVLPLLSHESVSMRSAGNLAVQAILDERKEKKIDIFDEATVLHKLNLPVIDPNESCSPLEWLDIDYRGSVAGLTTQLSVLQQTLFELVKIAATRPALEAVCAHACEMTAGLLRFESPEHMLLSNCEYLLRRWFEEGQRIDELPLVMTAPSVLHLLLRSRLPDSDSINKLREKAAYEYVQKMKHAVVPAALACALSKDSEGTPKRRVSSILNFGPFEGQVQAWVRKCKVDVFATFGPMRFSSDSEARTLGTDVLNFVQDELDPEDKNLAIRKILKLWGRQEYHFGAFEDKEDLGFREAINQLLNGKDVEPLGSGESLSIAFQKMDSNTVEFVLSSKYWLEECAARRDIAQGWSVFNEVCQAVVSQDTSHRGGLFACVQAVLDVILNGGLKAVQKEALQLLKSIVGDYPAQIDKEHLTPAIQKPVRALLMVHEGHQRLIADNSLCSWRRLQENLMRISGLAPNGVGGTWGWDEHTKADREDDDLGLALDHFPVAAKSPSASVLELSFDILEILLRLSNPKNSLLICDSRLASNCALGSQNHKFSTKDLVQTFQESTQRSDEEAFLSLSEKLVSTKSLYEFSNSYRGSLFTDRSQIEAELLLDDLTFLQKLLEEGAERLLRMNEPLSCRLVVELLALCSAQFPKQIQSAASRCLGAIGPEAVRNLSSFQLEAYQLNERTQLDSKDQGKGNIASGDAYLQLKVSALCLLGEYIVSPRTQTALVAVEAARALLAHDSSPKLVKLMPDEDCKQRLLLFQSASATSESPHTPCHYIESLKKKAGENDPSCEGQWCLNERIWNFTDETDYDQWICDLVSALIHCCYIQQADDHKSSPLQKSSSLRVHETEPFFRFFVNLCSLEAEFAACVFPGIVLELLLRTKSASTELESIDSPVQNNTWICDPDSATYKCLTQRFECLLKVPNTCFPAVVGQGVSSKLRAVSLLIDTLDLLRLVSQGRFISSQSHKPNSKRKSPRKSDQPVKKSRESARKKDSKATKTTPRVEDYNANLVDPGAKWAGVPYGTVLRLNGLQVVQACIFVKRFASALLYIEMYSDRAHGGSGAAMERIAREVSDKSSLWNLSVAADISGFRPSDDLTSSDSSTFSNKEDFMSMLEQCSVGLSEYGDLKETAREAAAVRFLDDDFERGADVFAETSDANHLKLLDARILPQKMGRHPALPILECMEELGLRNVLRTYVDGLIASLDTNIRYDLSSSDTREIAERYAKGSFDWETLSSVGATSTTTSNPCSGLELHKKFFGSLSGALVSFVRGDVETYRQSSEEAREGLVNETYAFVHGEYALPGAIEIVEKMQIMNDVDCLPENNFDQGLSTGWRRKTDAEVSNIQIDFSELQVQVPGFFELSSSAREIMLRASGAKLQLSVESEAKTVMRKNELIDHLRRHSSLARSAGRPDIATLYVQRLQSELTQRASGAIGRCELLQIRMEEAKNMERLGYSSDAIVYAKNVVKNISDYLKQNEKDSKGHALFVEALCKCGSWMAQRKTESAQFIASSYLNPAVTAAKDYVKLVGQEPARLLEAKQRLVSAHLSLAELASSMYDKISVRLNSELWKKQGESLETRKSTLPNDKFFQEKKEVARLEKERKREEASILDWLKISLDSLLGALTEADPGVSGDMTKYTFQLLSLWFGVSHTANYGEVSKILEKRLLLIPSYRFVPLVCQVFSRLGQQEGAAGEDFRRLLDSLVKKLCEEHPYHCIPHLLALSNGDKLGGDQRMDSDIVEIGKEKIDAAARIVKELLKSNSALCKGLMYSYKTLTERYIALAFESADTYGKSKTFASSESNLQKEANKLKKRYPMPCVFTKLPNIKPNKDYGDGKKSPEGSELIRSFHNMVQIVNSGLSKPKTIYCIGETGTVFKQVVKKDDDIRQDAVMLQFFGQVNNLLSRRRHVVPKTNRSSVGMSCLANDELKLFTYACVPLSPATGVIEWVENTTTLRDMICLDSAKKVGLHSKYYPGEWGYGMCVHHYKNSPPEVKRETFDVICQHYSPALRFFFLEQFVSSPQKWHMAKMNYTRSVATSSMVGHILGIGDRHTSNILLHKKTGEIIHIDFGITFEQGKNLATSEAVPFRLTRNIVDGMGPWGTVGTFTRACEDTLEVLRNNENIVRVILEAILADPLYQFKKSPVALWRRQQMEDAEEGNDNGSARMPNVKREEGENDVEVTPEARNIAGQRAMEKVIEKLHGYEEGSTESHSVEGQVQRLIKVARDGDNLCQMFQGWSPWV